MAFLKAKFQEAQSSEWYDTCENFQRQWKGIKNQIYWDTIYKKAYYLIGQLDELQQMYTPVKI